jgi:hypothetical protein
METKPNELEERGECLGCGRRLDGGSRDLCYKCQQMEDEDSRMRGEDFWKQRERS